MKRLTTEKRAFFKIEIIFFHALYWIKYGTHKYTDILYKMYILQFDCQL